MKQNKELVEKLRCRLKIVWIVFRRAVNGQCLPGVLVEAALDDLKRALEVLNENEETAEIRNKLQLAQTVLEKQLKGKPVPRRLVNSALADLEKVVETLIQIKASKKILMVLLFLLAISGNSYSRTLFDISGIMYSSEPAAVVNGRIVREKDEIEGFRVEKIERDCVRFSNGEEIFTQEINQRSPHLSSSLPIAKSEIEQSVIIKDVVKEEGVAEKIESPKDIPGFDHCLKAKENFDLAEEDLGKKNFAQAFIYYNKAIQYAQWALAYRIEGKRDEMKSIVRVSESQQRKIQEKSNVDEEIANTPYPKSKSPKEIAKWLKKNIKYQSDPKAHGERDYWQTPEETMVLRTGDCEDFAFLAQAMLKQVGIDSTVITVLYRGGFSGEKGHALCVYPIKNPKGVFSNYLLYKFDKNFMNYIQQEYSGWVNISVLDISSRKRVRILEKLINGFRKIDEWANAAIINDFLGDADEN